MINELYDEINNYLEIDSSIRIKNLNDIIHVINLIKYDKQFSDQFDKKLYDQFDEILYNYFYNFISIKYTLNNKIFYYIPYSVFKSLKSVDFSIIDLYEAIKLHHYDVHSHIQENMENDDIIYNEIMDYIETNGFVTTGLCDNEYYTDQYRIFKDKYLKFEIEDIFKSNKDIEDCIELCKIIKNKYYFSDNVKSLFSDYTFIHYEKYKSKIANIIKDIILN